MSTAAVATVLDARVEDPSTWRVLVTLADYVDPHGRHAFPSVTTLVERTGYVRSTVHRALTQLLEAGLIHRGDQQLVEHLPANRRPAVYDLDLPAIRGTRLGSDHRTAQGSDSRTSAGVRQGSDRGPTGVRPGAALGSDSSDTNQELTQIEPAGPPSSVTAELDVTTGRTTGRCAGCEQLVTPTLARGGRPVGTVMHQHPTGGLCPGVHLVPAIVAAPPGNYRAGAQRARKALRPDAKSA